MLVTLKSLYILHIHSQDWIKRSIFNHTYTNKSTVSIYIMKTCIAEQTWRGQTTGDELVLVQKALNDALHFIISTQLKKYLYGRIIQKLGHIAETSSGEIKENWQNRGDF